MTEIEIKVKGFKCERCEHIWIPRVSLKELTSEKLKEIPVICPKCKSPYWNKARKNEVDNK